MGINQSENSIGQITGGNAAGQHSAEHRMPSRVEQFHEPPENYSFVRQTEETTNRVADGGYSAGSRNAARAELAA